MAALVPVLTNKTIAKSGWGAFSGLLGAVLVAASVGGTFWGIPRVLSVSSWPEGLQFFGAAVVFLAVVAGIFGSVVGLLKLAKKSGTPETPSYTAIALIGLFFVSLFGLAIAWWMDRLVYQNSISRPIGLVISMGFVAFSLSLGVRLFFSPGCANLATMLTGQGWFTGNSFKKAQGIRMRRITLSVLLVILGTGVWSLLGASGVRKGGDLDVSLPFTGQIRIEKVGDALFLVNRVSKDDIISRESFAQIREQLNPELAVKIGIISGDSQYKTNDIVLKERISEETRAFREQGLKTPAETVNPVLPEGTLVFGKVPLLPTVQYSLPLLILGLGFWFSWRLVNVPLFAEFLISTDGEMNKVSWAGWKKLMQDTVVVLTTLLMFAVLLFVMDIAWKQILSSNLIGVLKFKESVQDREINVDRKPW
ncbi:MAG: preprotein translocase subunit SecE [Planctomycetota bacterium]|nr:preprotein translocase subunit SecE [Planctomycetota bacterium]